MEKKLSHTVMPKKLAEALIESGVQHFDVGGVVGGLFGGGPEERQSNISAPKMQEYNFIPQMLLHTQQAQDVYNQQQSLAQALLAQSQGQGPNPAQAMLAQQTGQNAQAQAALMASQRGASVNPALIARQAAMQGAGMQQQATGQAAIMQAQQQLAAQQALQQQQQIMGGQQYNLQALQQQGLANMNDLSMRGQLANEAIAGQNLAGRNAQIAARNAAMGNLINTAGAAAGMAAFGPAGAAPFMSNGSSGPISPSGSSPRGNTAGGMSQGGEVPGTPEVDRDSPKNDKVHALLSPGEVVLPLSVTQSKDPIKAAVSFLKELKIEEKKGYEKVVSAKKSVSERLEALEKFACGGQVKSYADGGFVDPFPKSAMNVLSGIGKGAGTVAESALNKLAMMPPENPPLEAPAPTESSGLIASTTPSLPTKEVPVSEFNIAAPKEPGALDQYQAASSLEQKGIMDAAKAQADLAKAQAATYAKANADLDRYMSKANEKLALQDQENKRLSDDIAATKIDPNKLWNDMGTGNKIGAAVAMIFSGIGAAMSGQQNMAMAVIDKAIERDLEAQKANLGKKESLLSANLRKYGDMQAAQHATILQMNAITQGKIAQDAARLGSPVALANAQVALGELQKKDLMQKQALSQYVQTNAAKAAIAGSQGGVDAELYRKLPKDLKETMAPLPNGKFVDVGDKGKAEEAAMLMNKNANIQNNISNIEKLVKKYGTFELTGPAERDMKQYIDAIATDAAILFDPKTGVKEGELQKFKDMLFTPGTLTTTNRSAVKNIQNMRKMMKDRESVYYKSLGLSPDAVGVNASELKIKDGIPYRKVQGGWVPVK